jgi:hypothetical protein
VERAPTTPAKRMPSGELSAGGEPRERTVTRSNGELLARPRSPLRRPQTLALISAAVVAVAGGALALTLLSRARPAPVVAQPPSRAEPPTRVEPPTPAPPAPALVDKPAAAPRQVHLSVRGTAGAEVRLDGRDSGRVPLELDLPAQPAERALTVERAGYLPLARKLDGGADATVDATLHRKKQRSTQEPEIKDPFSR